MKAADREKLPEPEFTDAEVAKFSELTHENDQLSAENQRLKAANEVLIEQLTRSENNWECENKRADGLAKELRELRTEHEALVARYEAKCLLVEANARLRIPEPPPLPPPQVIFDGLKRLADLELLEVDAAYVRRRALYVQLSACAVTVVCALWNIIQVLRR